MPDYKESTVSGSTWQRCHTVTISNQLGKPPRVDFQEEKVIALVGDDIHQWTSGCTKAFDAAAEFPLLDPVTNTPTGQTMTHAGLYQALYSLYMQAAAERDAQAEG